MRRLLNGLLAVGVQILVSCCGPFEPPAASEEVLVMCYNVQALFDPIDQGGEYEDYSVARGTWDESRYRRRLELLSTVILATRPAEGNAPPGPELVCLEEVENEAVLACLAKEALEEGKYRYQAFAGSPGSALGVGLLSRFPIVNAKAHGLRVEDRELRPILEAELETSGGPLIVFVCHWKSKTEGARSTEPARRESAALVSRLAAEAIERLPGAAVVICGDFNENPDEYERIGKRYQTALLPAEREADFGPTAGTSLLVVADPKKAGLQGNSLFLYSPWLASSGYSYSFDGERERIDGFLLGPGLFDGEGMLYCGFSSFDADFLMDSSGRPVEWSNSRSAGYSDHLPILLYLKMASGASTSDT